MVGYAIDHVCLAGTANAFGTGEGNVDAGVQQRIQNSVARLNRNGASAAMQPNVKSTVRYRNRIVCHRRRPKSKRTLKRIAKIGSEFCCHVLTAEVHPRGAFR